MLVDAIRDCTHSPATLLQLLAWLPDDSALAASVNDTPRGWGADRHLTATVVDAIQANTWVTASANSKRKPRKPKPMNRPKSNAKPAARVVRVADLT